MSNEQVSNEEEYSKFDVLPDKIYKNYIYFGIRRYSALQNDTEEQKKLIDNILGWIDLYPKDGDDSEWESVYNHKIKELSKLDNSSK